MPILMVAQQQFNNINYSDSQPLDFTMSKFKSSSPAKHPLYHQFFGSGIGDTSQEEQGELSDREIIYNTFSIDTRRPTAVCLRDSLITLYIHFPYQSRKRLGNLTIYARVCDLRVQSYRSYSDFVRLTLECDAKIFSLIDRYYREIIL